MSHLCDNSTLSVKTILTKLMFLTLNHFAGAELAQLFHDAPTTELPLSMLSSSGDGRLTVVDLAVRSGAAKSKCKYCYLFYAMTIYY